MAAVSYAVCPSYSAKGYAVCVCDDQLTSLCCDFVCICVSIVCARVHVCVCVLAHVCYQAAACTGCAGVVSLPRVHASRATTHHLLLTRRL